MLHKLFFLLIGISFIGVSYGSGDSSDLSQSSDWTDSSFLQNTYLAAHNSYHKRQIVSTTTSDGEPIDDLDIFVPVDHQNYPSLTELLEHGVCGFEIDFYPKENENDDDFPVQHVFKYDNKTTCTTLSECILEINDYLNNNKHNLQCEVIMIHLDLKIVDDFPNDSILEINNIIGDILGKHIFTPKKLGAKSNQQHWPNWLKPDGTTKIKSGQVFFTMNKPIIVRVFPEIEFPSKNKGTLSAEKTFNIFALCDGIWDDRFCVVAKNYINDIDKNRYPFSKFVGERHIQSSQFNIVDIGYDPAFSGSTFYVQLLQEIVDDALYLFQTEDLTALEINVTAQEAFDLSPLPINSALIESGWIPWKWWNAWMLFAYADALGDADGKIDTEEVADFAFEGSYRVQSAYDAVVYWLEYTDSKIFLGLTDADIPSPIYGKGLDINNPFVWYMAATALDGSFDIIVPNIDDDAVITTTCDAIKEGYHYIYSDYPYELSTNDGFIWPFVVKDYLDDTKQCPT